MMFSSTNRLSHSDFLNDTHIWGFSALGPVQKRNDGNITLWLAHATFDSVTTHAAPTVDPVNNLKNNHKLRQQQAVRLLLSQLIDTIKQQDKPHHSPLHDSSLWLDESTYPFRLMPSNYQVCFTHSHDQVACAIAQQGRMGIDLEVADIPLHIAQRFFHFEEVAWLNTLNKLHQQAATKLLWSLKESFIKQNSLTNLFQGLGTNSLSIAKALFEQSISQLPRQAVHTSCSTNTIFYSTQNVDSKYIYVYLPANQLVLINTCR